MSLVPTKHTIYYAEECAAEWRLCSSVDTTAQMIPPSNDALMIRFMFYKETMHTFTPDRYAQEYWMIPQSPTKAIRVRPSEFHNHNSTSIMQSPSGRMMVDFINTYFPPEDKEDVPIVVAQLIDLVQNSIQSETKGFVDVQRRDTIEIMHHLDDEATRACMHGYFEATKRGTCAICMDDFEIGRDDAIRLPCLHVFHGPCIFKWLGINPHCPICWHTFKKPELAPWFNTPLQEDIWMLHSSI